MGHTFHRLVLLFEVCASWLSLSESQAIANLRLETDKYSDGKMNWRPSLFAWQPFGTPACRQHRNGRLPSDSATFPFVVWMSWSVDGFAKSWRLARWHLMTCKSWFDFDFLPRPSQDQNYGPDDLLESGRLYDVVPTWVSSCLKLSWSGRKRRKLRCACWRFGRSPTQRLSAILQEQCHSDCGVLSLTSLSISGSSSSQSLVSQPLSDRIISTAKGNKRTVSSDIFNGGSLMSNQIVLLWLHWRLKTSSSHHLDCWADEASKFILSEIQKEHHQQQLEKERHKQGAMSLPFHQHAYNLQQLFHTYKLPSRCVLSRFVSTLPFCCVMMWQ